ncbi:bifunctional helix-turn-helix domain-containing protein/methylated-DNA--[protein]-cysteine S-methyltransferase [Falsirhodobacter sp. 20TX0035]|uniref:bifunctional helix-turn-helix domain-containing protein/methylated-DNA--[protein]-cysteine S-methyltransferase n=1 Tax=Falsirhodobacter sp. 20TX0035 TaxID=3022019 RepID=UPI00232CB62A|nr:bifunctional helix-turn-helix domain-containing protein/methylated-DNA--[protein]-cysteine S-methyltransferase [Falsirhodobacter sp. 20TX0035]MDB6452254.1 bifunctional helix-turn-helix domain-containing protein/methylated-DNA--[protein]-cysteine S-methyltransferase [Falsirhodobacter sp. 20TX0035]
MSYHYAIIARALDAIADRPDLSLEEVAAVAGLSPAHFQRVFSAWVGVSPKRFAQYLALDHARHLLAAQTPVLEASHAAGLSGGGRLHDLFLRWEGMSPGDYARAGAGLRIGWTRTPSPFGEAVVMATARGICGIGFTDPGFDAFTDLARRWPRAVYEEDGSVAVLAEAAFAGRPTRLHLMGGPFQIKVWEALLSVPSGQVTTYGDIATAIGQPTAVRAVGTAIGRNAISWLIPCHRAVRKTGALGGYHWGLTRKRAMLAHEAARRDAADVTAELSESVRR